MKKNLLYDILRTAKWGFLNCMLLAAAACSNEWDDHYDAGSGTVTDKTLWDVVSAQSNVSQFTDVLKLTGYDQILSENRVYTIWAPANGSFDKDSLVTMIEAGKKEAVINDFVKNHISDYLYTASGTFEKKVKMLNEKFIDFVGAGGNYTFQGFPLTGRNFATKNGLVHFIGHITSYSTNIWEYLAVHEELDSIKEFLYSDDKEIFDRYSSVQGPIVNGQVTYLDSVMINSNPWFYSLGKLNEEDSTYTMFVPTNEVWNEMLAKTRTYYRYQPSKSASVQHVRDSLYELYSRYAILKNLVFSKSVQVNTEDSLTSTGRHTFRYAERDSLFANCDAPVTLSNGTVYVARSFNYRSTVNWHDTIKVEAENSTGRTESSCAADVHRVSSSNKNDTMPGLISRDQYLVCSPVTSTGSPSVTFTIPNVLSATYKIKCVFVPANITSNTMSSDEIKPNKVRFQLKNSILGSTNPTTSINISGVVNDPSRIDTVLVRNIDKETKDTIDTFAFPICEYGLEQSEYTTTLTVMTNVNRTETNYDRTLRIDCIILEPVEE